MPTYDYRCQECGAVEEIQHKLDEQAPPCDCGGQREKVMSAPAFRIAGPKGPIWDDRQIKDTHGEDWRRTPGSDTPGGAGRKMISDGGRPASFGKLPPGSWGGDIK